MNKYRTLTHRCLYLGRIDSYISELAERFSRYAPLELLEAEGQKDLLKKCYEFEPMLILTRGEPDKLAALMECADDICFRRAVCIVLAPAESIGAVRLGSESVVTGVAPCVWDPDDDIIELMRVYRRSLKLGLNIKTLSDSMPIVTDLTWYDTGRDSLVQRAAISDKLARHGVRPELAGHKYLIAAIALQSAARMAPEPIKLYRRVAAYYSTTPLAVEKAVRYAIESAWVTGDIFYQQELFGMTVSEDRGKPTNAEFIARLALDL